MNDLGDDKRTVLESEQFWVERISLRRWRYCKYCYRKTPQFLFSEGCWGNSRAVQSLRCCWECGSGIEVLNPRVAV